MTTAQKVGSATTSKPALVDPPALAELLATASNAMSFASSGLDEASLRAQHDPEFSPIAWHLGHVIWQEELWILRRFARQPALDASLDRVFDSFTPDKGSRGQRVPGPDELQAYGQRVRRRVVELLPRLCEVPATAPMVGPNLVRFVANHTRQHTETVLGIRLAASLALPGSNSTAAVRRTPTPGYVALGASEARLGTDRDPDRWDNESSQHSEFVGPFEIGKYPVTNQQWVEFVDQGGYLTRSLWCEAGWTFVRTRGIEAPLYWKRDATGAWLERTLTGTRQLELAHAVCHVSWYEAQAFARFAGARLPSEAEWERAASSAADGKRRYPWGNECDAPATWGLGLVTRAPVGHFKRAVSEAGVFDLCGGVWEWTAEDFRPYPGFRPQAYRGYSEPWFDGRHRVARGGCYATQAEIARSTFRNFYLPEMRQPFLGLRLARSLP